VSLAISLFEPASLYQQRSALNWKAQRIPNLPAESLRGFAKQTYLGHCVPGALPRSRSFALPRMIGVVAIMS